ncbi:hypothetical protein Bhyg_03483 [Pseudolycoriella hygida]|uniref:THAP-type domain-containing protein n=1 Tax=Pseudolycoriella hygida TaxID=35572 RepID=A0A9Q0NEV4_9DIPT|nr:hypothetical protein Bhyg_03483 [Pseudolycoriella hygida]
MPQKCVIKTCSNSTSSVCVSSKNLIFHRLPLNPLRRLYWIINIQMLANQSDPIADRAIICSDHFDERSYEMKSYGRKVLLESAEPLIFNHVKASASDLETVSAMKEFIISTNIDDEPSETPVLRIRDKNTEAPMTIRTIPIAHLTQQKSATDSTDAKCDDDIVEIKSVQEEIRPVAIYSSFMGNIRTQDAQHRLSSARAESPFQHKPTLPQRLQYPEEVVNMQLMNRQQLQNNLELCKKKLREHTATIKALRRLVLNKDRQILTLRTQVKALKRSSANNSSDPNLSLRNELCESILS